LKELLQGLLQKDPAERWASFEIIKGCAWLSEVDWDKILQKTYDDPAVQVNIYESNIH